MIWKSCWRSGSLYYFFVWNDWVGRRRCRRQPSFFSGRYSNQGCHLSLLVLLRCGSCWRFRKAIAELLDLLVMGYDVWCMKLSTGQFFFHYFVACWLLGCSRISRNRAGDDRAPVTDMEGWGDGCGGRLRRHYRSGNSEQNCKPETCRCAWKVIQCWTICTPGEGTLPVKLANPVATSKFRHVMACCRYNTGIGKKELQKFSLWLYCWRCRKRFHSNA